MILFFCVYEIDIRFDVNVNKILLIYLNVMEDMGFIKEYKTRRFVFTKKKAMVVCKVKWELKLPSEQLEQKATMVVNF
jgi:hypothetical protein